MLSQIVAVFQYSSPFGGPAPPSLLSSCRRAHPFCGTPRDAACFICLGWSSSLELGNCILDVAQNTQLKFILALQEARHKYL